ncbi:MAG: molybdate ABC transporter substrate-binding protein [Fibrobacterales bacterium]
MRQIVWLHIFIVFMVTIQGCDEQKKERDTSPLIVHVAASFSDVIEELISLYNEKHTIKILVNKGSSGTLARQLVSGAPGDLYISANPQWAHYLDSVGLAYNHTLVPITYNRLVLIGQNGAQAVVIDSASLFFATTLTRKIALGDPAHVPAGKYAQEALTYYGWFERLAQNMVPTKDVRSALMAVETGEVPYGIVYRSDALRSKKVSILGVFPEQSHSSITYTAMQISGAEEASALFQFLGTENAQKVFKKYGFVQ